MPQMLLSTTVAKSFKTMRTGAGTPSILAVGKKEKEKKRDCVHCSEQGKRGEKQGEGLDEGDRIDLIGKDAQDEEWQMILGSATKRGGSKMKGSKREKSWKGTRQKR